MGLEPLVSVNELGAVFEADTKARALAEQWLDRNAR